MKENIGLKLFFVGESIVNVINLLLIVLFYHFQASIGMASTFLDITSTATIAMVMMRMVIACKVTTGTATATLAAVIPQDTTVPMAMTSTA